MIYINQQNIERRITRFLRSAGDAMIFSKKSGRDFSVNRILVFAEMKFGDCFVKTG